MIGLKVSPRPWILELSARAKCQPVGAGLFLDDAPLARLPLLHGDETLDETGPFDSPLDLDNPPLRVETKDSPHRARVDENAAGGELLTAHRVPSSGDADRLTASPCVRNRLSEVSLGLDRDDAVDFGRVELRMNVVNVDAPLRPPADIWQHGETDPSLCRESEELPASRHAFPDLRADRGSKVRRAGSGIVKPRSHRTLTLEAHLRRSPVISAATACAAWQTR